jgi:hypothetical protein
MRQEVIDEALKAEDSLDFYRILYKNGYNADDESTWPKVLQDKYKELVGDVNFNCIPDYF